MGAEVSSVVTGAAAGFQAGKLTGYWGFNPLVAAGTFILATAFSYQQIKQQERKQDEAARRALAAASGLRGLNVRQPITTRKVIYGQALVGGPYAFIHTTNNNSMLHLVIPVAGHEVESFDAFFIDGEHVPVEELIAPAISPNVWWPPAGSKYHGKFYVTPMTGKDDQQVPQVIHDYIDPDLWTDAHRGRGVAYMYVRLIYDRDVFSGGIPNISAVVRGRKVYDPRSPNADPAWTDNSALVLRDFMTNEDWGLGFTNDQIDDAQFIAAANRADQDIALATPLRSVDFENLPEQTPTRPSADGYYYVGDNQQYIHNGDRVSFADELFTSFGGGIAFTNGAGGIKLATTVANARAGIESATTFPANTDVTVTRARGLQYTINGVVDTATNPRQTLVSFLDAQETSFVFTGGKVRLIPPTAPVKTGAYETGGNLIGEQHIIGPKRITPKIGRRDQVNIIRGIYISPANNWQPTDYPQAELLQADIDRDGGPLVSEIPLEYTISQAMAQRISRGILYQERRQRTITFTMDLRGLRFQVGDFVYIRSRYNRVNDQGIPQDLFADIPFRVVSFSLATQKQGRSQVLVCRITAQEHPTRLLQWGVNDEQPLNLAPTTLLPNPAAGIVPPNSLDLASGNSTLILNADGTVTSVLRATWVRPVTGFPQFFEIGYKKTSEGNNAWRNTIIPASSVTHDLAPVEDNVAYDVRIRSQSNGLYSDYVTVTSHLVLGKTERPPTPLTQIEASTLPNGTRRLVFDIENAPFDVQFGGGGALIRWSTDLSAAWEAMTPLRGRFRASPYETQEIPEGRVRLALKWADSSGNESEVARFSEHTLGPQDTRETFLQRSEADLDNDWAGTLGANTVKVNRNSITRANQLMATAPSGTDFRSLNRTFGDLAPTFDDLVFSPRFIDYTTPVIALSTTLTFAVSVEMDYTGFIHTRTIRYSNTLTAGGALASPQTVPFNEGQPTNSITARYAQVVVQVRPPSVSGGQARKSAVLRDLRVEFRGDTTPHPYTNLNTATATSSTVPGFNRLAAGRFTLEHPTAGSILSAQLEFQGAETSSSGTRYRVVSKNALASPRVGVEIRIYNSAGVLTDDTVDVVLQGTRLGVVRDPVDSTG